MKVDDDKHCLVKVQFKSLPRPANLHVWWILSKQPQGKVHIVNVIDIWRLELLAVFLSKAKKRWLFFFFFFAKSGHDTIETFAIACKLSSIFFIKTVIF